MTTASTPIRVFVSYAAEDDAHRIELEKHLMVLQRQGLIETWSDRKILPGGQWGDEIDTELERADLVLCLLSANFFASDYINDIEVERALERDAAGEARVVPIVVEYCDWQPSRLGRQQALPERAEPVTSNAWSSPAQAWTSVARGIRQIATGFERPRKDRSGEPPLPAGTVELRRYLEAVREKHSYVEIRGMGAKVSERMPLTQVYTRLRVASPESHAGDRDTKRGMAEAGELRRETDRDLSDVIDDHRHAAIVGDPGSGKTTFLRYVAQNLARAHLGETQLLARIGLAGEAPLPIFVKLDEFSKFLEEHPDPSCTADSPKHFLRYLDFRTNSRPQWGLPAKYLADRVTDGHCFLLLDGLDEVPGEAHRKTIASLIGNVVTDGANTNRHLITCRTRAWQGLVQLGGTTAVRLVPFAWAQIEQFCKGWCQALFRVRPGDTDSQTAVDAESYRQSLIDAIKRIPAGDELTGSPLMLTVLAVVHWTKKQLPEQRAELYDNAVEYLLESRAKQCEHPTPIRRECLQAVALQMFTDAEGVQRSIGRDDAAQAVMTVMGITQDEARKFIEEEQLYSGIVVSRIEGELQFWHLTFQEYLTALEISQQEDWWAGIAPHLYDDRWSEVVLLMAGCMRRGGLRTARRMIGKVLETGTDRVSTARAVALVGRVLRDILPYGGDPSTGTDYADKLRATLGIFEPGGDTVEEPVRVEVGEALGRAGDPRLGDPVANRVSVDDGTFWMGAQDQDKNGSNYDSQAYEDERPVHEVRVSALVVGRFPVTVQEFSAFVEAGDDGYLNPTNWHPDGWAWREAERIDGPKDWRDQGVHPNRPVVGVSWYEADAYCRWAGARLPTEAEWEWLARGNTARRYAWGGDEPTKSHANFAMHVGEATPVGIYPLGATPDGIHDLSGNVWEWCADWLGPYSDKPESDPTGPAKGEGRVLRGGAFFYDPRHLRAAYRFYVDPVFRLGGFGFRVVWSAPGGQD